MFVFSASAIAVIGKSPNAGPPLSVEPSKASKTASEASSVLPEHIP